MKISQIKTLIGNDKLIILLPFICGMSILLGSAIAAFIDTPQQIIPHHVAK